MFERLFPMVRWLRTYQRGWLVPDTVAGLTVWALVVPESMAYASIAGVPVQYGLYSVPLAIVGYALFGSSKRLFDGPSSTVAVLSASTVAPVAAAGTDNFITMTAVLSLLVGVLYIAFGIARLGFISRFFAKPVLDGFIVGLGLFIAVGQLYKVVGAPKPSGDTLEKFWDVIRHPSEWNGATTVVGVGALVLLFVLAAVAPKIPGALVVVVLGITATKAFDLAEHGVQLVGNVPTGFNFVSWSGISASDVWTMVPGALAIIIVGFAQSLAIAKTYSARDGEPIDANREMIGYGAASIGAGVLQGFTPTGSLSKSAAAEEAGGKTPISFLVTAALVVLTVLFIAGVFEDLPEAALGAIVIHAVSGMVKPAKLTRLWKAHVPDFFLALGALLGVVLFGIVAGIVIGLVLSLVLVVHRLDHPHTTVLGRVEADGRFASIEAHSDAVTTPGVLVVRLDAPLIFANADVVNDQIRALVEAAPTPVQRIVFDFEAVYEMDTEGTDALVHLATEMDARGIRLVIARAHTAVLDFLRRDGTMAQLGEDRCFADVTSAASRPGTDG